MFRFAFVFGQRARSFKLVCVCGVHKCNLYINEQQREAWAQIACMMLVPGCEGIGMLTQGVRRIGTMRWLEPWQLIEDVRRGEFV